MIFHPVKTKEELYPFVVNYVAHLSVHAATERHSVFALIDSLLMERTKYGLKSTKAQDRLDHYLSEHIDGQVKGADGCAISYTPRPQSEFAALMMFLVLEYHLNQKDSSTTMYLTMMMEILEPEYFSKLVKAGILYDPVS